MNKNFSNKGGHYNRCWSDNEKSCFLHFFKRGHSERVTGTGRNFRIWFWAVWSVAVWPISYFYGVGAPAADCQRGAGWGGGRKYAPHQHKTCEMGLHFPHFHSKRSKRSITGVSHSELAAGCSYHWIFALLGTEEQPLLWWRGLSGIGWGTKISFCDVDCEKVDFSYRRHWPAVKTWKRRRYLRSPWNCLRISGMALSRVSIWIDSILSVNEQ